MTAILLILLVAAVYWMCKPEKKYTTTEWRERMKDLGLGCK
jgi:cbb3-type cytochrome oxidase subunit 3